MAKVFVITGPSGVGKGTLIGELRERLPEVELSVSATTRPPRPGEAEGRDYHFLDSREFERLVGEGAFLEHASYSGNRYGTLREEVAERIGAGSPVVLEIEVQGARQIAARLPDAVMVFVAPPSHEALRERLTGRGTDSEETIDRRLEVARTELEAQSEFTYVLVNDELERAAGELERIVRGELQLH